MHELHNYAPTSKFCGHIVQNEYYELLPNFNSFIFFPPPQLIKAEDEGGLSSTATVNIRVTDINDKNPEFQSLPYEFSVPEGQDGLAVGRVHATDADEGQNAVVYYSVPEDIPFVVDANTGDIRTNKALDYEKQQVRRSFLIYSSFLVA
jgi:Cadherin domain.